MGAGGDGPVLTTANGVPDAITNGTANGITGDLANALRSHQLSDKAFPTVELPPDAADNWNYHEDVTDIDKRDVGTPDSWVPRHPQLIRLTGRYAIPLRMRWSAVPDYSAPAVPGSAPTLECTAHDCMPPLTTAQTHYFNHSNRFCASAQPL